MNVIRLSRMPALVSRFPRAGLLSLRRRGRLPSRLPGHTLEFGGITVDSRALARYRRVCGFADSGELPLTYPYIPAFRLAMVLMTDPRFPLPPVGLVHIDQHIEQLTPLPAKTPFTLRVHAENLVKHHHGHRFDLVTELFHGREPVWRQTSGYLSKWHSSSTAGGAFRAEPPPPTMTESWDVSAGTGRRYAMASGDFNPIHLHPFTARPFGLRRPIVHGMWSLARCVARLECAMPACPRDLDARFHKPLSLPSHGVTFHSQAFDSGIRFAVHGPGRRPHLTATMTASSKALPTG